MRGSSANASFARSTLTSTGQSHVLVGGIAADEHVEPFELELFECPPRELEVAVVRRVEGAAEEPDHFQIIVSSPTSTSEPVRAPAARSARSSSSPSGGTPVTRKPRSVRRIRYARAVGSGR